MKLPCGKVRVDKSWPDLETFFCGDSNHFLKFGYATIQWVQLISNPGAGGSLRAGHRVN